MLLRPVTDITYETIDIEMSMGAVSMRQMVGPVSPDRYLDALDGIKEQQS